jgi:hypothetical protein
MRYRVRVSSVADDGGLNRIRLYTQQTQIDIHKTNHKHKVDNMASVNKPRASATARASREAVTT